MVRPSPEEIEAKQIAKSNRRKAVLDLQAQPGWQVVVEALERRVKRIVKDYAHDPAKANLPIIVMQKEIEGYEWLNRIVANLELEEAEIDRRVSNGSTIG